MNDEPFTLKESLFSPETVELFGQAIAAEYQPFDLDSFLTQIFDDSWANRALMDRLHRVTHVLHQHLPSGYTQALSILLGSQSHLTGGFVGMVPSDYVATYGLDNLDASIPAIEQFTQAISAEFSVRHFIARYPERMMAQMLLWADHEHEGVRRLASEGSRPRLPWGIRLHELVKDPSPILPILEKLKKDPSESVRRSVANNLNDISKDHPATTVAVLKRWNTIAEDDKEIQWITSHALRTLLKAGDRDALELLGYPSDPQIELLNISLDPPLAAIGEAVTLTFEIQSTGANRQNLMIDYVVYHMRANGKQTPKVFKLKKTTIEPGQIISIKKKHSFRPITTRKYYPGAQGIQPQINGRLYERIDFELSD